MKDCYGDKAEQLGPDKLMSAGSRGQDTPIMIPAADQTPPQGAPARAPYPCNVGDKVRRFSALW